MGRNSKARRDAKVRKRAREQRQQQAKDLARLRAESTARLLEWDPKRPYRYAHNHPVGTHDDDGHPIPELGSGLVYDASLVEAMGEEFPGVWQGSEPPTIMDVILSATHYEAEPAEDLEAYIVWGAEWHWRNHNTGIEDFAEEDPTELIQTVVRITSRLADGRAVQLVWNLDGSRLPAGMSIEQELAAAGVTLPDRTATG